jgi:hypothetical protein
LILEIYAKKSLLIIIIHRILQFLQTRILIPDIKAAGEFCAAGQAFHILIRMGKLPVVVKKGKKFLFVFASGSIGINLIGIYVGSFIFYNKTVIVA